MKDQWERLTAHVDLDHATLTRLIQPVLPGQYVVNAEPLKGGLANTIYRITINGSDQALVVRLYTRDQRACQKDIDLYRLIHAHVPVPELLYADQSCQLVAAPYAITTFVDGVLLRDLLATGSTEAQQSAAYDVGRVRAAVDRFTFERSGFLGPDLVIDQPLVFNGEALQWYVHHHLFDQHGADQIGAAQADRLWQLVQDHAALLNDLQPTNVLVHADFNPPNLLMQNHDEQWRVAALLDWEFACAGPPLFDIAMMLRHDLSLRSPWSRDLIHGYMEAGGVVPAQWQRMCKLLDLFNLCDFLVRAPAGSAMLRDVAGLIDQTIVRWNDLGAATG